MISKKMKLALTVLAILSAPTAFGQGVPTIDVTSIAKLQEMIAEQKLQLREQIAQNVKLDEQTLKLVEQIRTLEAQLDALRNGLSLADLGLDPASFLRDILPDFSDLSKSLDAAKAGNWSGVLANASQIGGTSVTGYVDKTFEQSGIERSDVDALASSDDTRAIPEALRGTLEDAQAAAGEIRQIASELRESGAVGQVRGMVEDVGQLASESVQLGGRQLQACQRGHFGHVLRADLTWADLAWGDGR